MRAKPESRRVREVLGLIEVAALVEYRGRDILRILFQRWETARFAECELLLGNRCVQ